MEQLAIYRKRKLVHFRLLDDILGDPFKSRLRQRVRPPRRNGGLEQSRVSGGEELKNLYHPSVHSRRTGRRLEQYYSPRRFGSGNTIETRSL
jgi:hypothetical protein